MIWVCGINPQNNLRGVHDVFLLFRTSGTRGKTKTANPSGRRCQSSGGDFIQRVSSRHIIGKFSFQITGTLALPLPGCQTHLRVIPDVDLDRIGVASKCNKILCHSTQSSLPMRIATMGRFVLLSMNFSYSHSCCRCIKSRRLREIAPSSSRTCRPEKNAKAAKTTGARPRANQAVTKLTIL
jgi:hypothetical protein